MEILFCITFVAILLAWEAFVFLAIYSKIGDLMLRANKLLDSETIKSFIKRDTGSLFKSSLYRNILFNPFVLSKVSIKIKAIKQYIDDLEHLRQEENRIDHNTIIIMLNGLRTMLLTNLNNDKFIGKKLNKKQMDVVAQSRNYLNQINSLVNNSEKSYLMKLYSVAGACNAQLKNIEAFI